MADRDSGLEMAATTPSACEAMLWDGWPTASAADEASTTTLSQLPELAASSSRGGVAFHHHSDMLSSFLACDDQSNAGNGAFAFQLEPDATVSSSARNHVHHLGPMLQFQNLQPSKIMWPESPSSPLALHKWDHGPWPGATSIQMRHDAMADNSQRLDLFSSTDQRQASFIHGTDQSRGFVPGAAHNSDSVHSNFEPPPSSVWTSCTRSQQLTNFVRIAQEQRSVDSCSDRGNCSDPQGKSPGLQSGKQHKQLLGLDHGEPPPKRPHLQPVDHGGALWHGHRSLYPPSTASPAIFAIGPALNTNGKPRARRGSATDPQSVYARHRREKINERLKTLQHLVPNGAKVDIVTMLDEAVHYVQFLQLQVKLLKSDKYWMHATPNSYKGIDLTCPVPHTETQGELGSSA